MNNINWPQAFAIVGGAFAAAWAIRSFSRLLNGDKP